MEATRHAPDPAPGRRRPGVSDPCAAPAVRASASTVPCTVFHVHGNDETGQAWVFRPVRDLSVTPGSTSVVARFYSSRRPVPGSSGHVRGSHLPGHQARQLRSRGTRTSSPRAPRHPARSTTRAPPRPASGPERSTCWPSARWHTLRTPRRGRRRYSPPRTEHTEGSRRHPGMAEHASSARGSRHAPPSELAGITRSLDDVQAGTRHAAVGQVLRTAAGDVRRAAQSGQFPSLDPGDHRLRPPAPSAATGMRIRPPYSLTMATTVPASRPAAYTAQTGRTALDHAAAGTTALTTAGPGLPCSDFLPGPSGAHARRAFRNDVRARPRGGVPGLNQDPPALACAGQGEASGQLAAVQGEGQVAGVIAGDLGGSLVPDDHSAAAPQLPLVYPLELTGRQARGPRPGQPARRRTAGSSGRAFRHGPGPQHLADSGCAGRSGVWSRHGNCTTNRVAGTRRQYLQDSRPQ